MDTLEEYEEQSACELSYDRESSPGIGRCRKRHGEVSIGVCSRKADGRGRCEIGDERREKLTGISAEAPCSLSLASPARDRRESDQIGPMKSGEYGLMLRGARVKGVCRCRSTSGLESRMVHSQCFDGRGLWNKITHHLLLHPPDALSLPSLLHTSLPRPPTARQRKIINEYYRHGGSSPSIAWRVPVLAQDFARHTAFAQHQHQCRSGQHVQLAGNCWSLPRHGQGIGCPEHSPQHSLVRYLWWLPSLQRSHYPCPSCLPAHHPC